MGLRQTVSEWIRNAKDALDFGPDFPAAMAAHRLEFTEERTNLSRLRRGLCFAASVVVLA